MCIGGVVLAMALAEDTANDWLPLIMVDGHGFDATMGSLVFALFAASRTIGRFSGGPIVERVGRSRVLLVSALFAATGLALIAYVDSQVVAVVAVALWGLGASLGFPSRSRPSRRCSAPPPRRAGRRRRSSWGRRKQGEGPRRLFCEVNRPCSSAAPRSDVQRSGLFTRVHVGALHLDGRVLEGDGEVCAHALVDLLEDLHRV